MTFPAPGAGSRPARGTTRSPAGPRRNRGWLVFLLLTPVVMTVLAVLAFTTKGPPEPSIKARSVPAGYRTISDAYFGYAIPSSWAENQLFTDANGDFFYQGRSGWVGENVRIRSARPRAGTDVPAQLATFGQGRPVPYQLSAGRPVAIPGVAAAWAY
ncbi:MAG: hypothetical protein M3137_11455, partial [Actinomycetota bacterium]|nr:hypothetical protein [Actinomycetota bacterium]